MLIDINVLIDVVEERVPWYRDSVALLDALSRGRGQGFLAGHSVTTLYYLAKKSNGHIAASTVVSDALALATVVPLTNADFLRALSLGFKDFEDAVQVAAALQAGCDFIATRNTIDFAGSPIPALMPGVIAARLSMA